MKNLIIAAFFGFASIAHAAGHQVTLSWTPSIDSTTADPGTVTVRRILGTCPADPTAVAWTVLTTAASATGPYVDLAVSGKKTYCYVVTAVIDGVESDYSNMTQATIPPGSPKITGVAVK